MARKLLYCLVVFLFVVTNSVLAHTQLKDSTPKKGEVIKQEIQEITLKFNTKVEYVKSLQLTGQNGEVIKPDQTSKENQTVKASFANPIPNGKFTAEWDIIGVDGHQITGKIQFEVAALITAPKTVEEKPAPEKVAVSSLDTPQQNSGETQEKVVAAPSQSDEKETSALNMTFLVVVIALIGFVSLFWLMRRKA